MTRRGSALVPLALGAGVVYLAVRSGSRMLTGAIPGNRPYVWLVFAADRKVGFDESDFAAEAARRVQGMLVNGSPALTIVNSASQASSGGLSSTMYTTVVARVAGFLVGQPWATILAPLQRGEGSVSSFLYQVKLVESGLSSGSLDLSRQLALASTGNPGILDQARNALNTLTKAGKIAAVAAVVVGGYIVWREIKPLVVAR